MNPLEKIIIDKIKKEGPITFETFMNIALYYPELGYYTSPKIEIGRKGDFYTSPHLHRIFGAMIGKQLEEMWEILEKPPVFHAVEIGAGAGYLCKDILDYLKNKDIFNSLTYTIVEINPHLQKNQEKLVADFKEKVTWVSSLNEIITSKKNNPFISPLTGKGGYKGGSFSGQISGCIFSNELLDAFPVHVIEMEDELKEIYINFDNNNFIEQKLDISLSDILNYLKKFNIEIPAAYRTEINLKIKDWLKEISEILYEGFVLTIDYGYTAEEYYDRERTKGTLLCYYKHQTNENPYENIGEQDITAHVNFSSLKKWGEENGLKTIGYCPQGTYLISLGIDEVITEIYGDSADYSSEILNIKNLILPQGMGESHRVMIQYKGKGLPKLKGFSLRNQINHL